MTVTFGSAINLDDMVEVSLNEGDFLKVKETLERIGIGYNTNKVLYPSCYILHKRSKYYLVHFKEMFMLDGKVSNFTDDDRARRNTIALLLQEWGLLKVANEDKVKQFTAPLSRIKIIPFKEKKEWTISHKYHIGKARKDGE